MRKDQEIIDECNEECVRCRKDFEKSEIEFNPKMCSVCSTGIRLHKALCRENDGEKAWNEINWTESKWKRYYKG